MSAPRTWLVTGAASGIGLALAQALQERGERLVLPVRDERRAAEVGGRFPGAHVPVADLADAAAVVDLAARLVAGGDGWAPLTRLDGLVHCAGVVDLEAVEDLDPARWRTQVDVNLTAPALLTGPLLPALRAAGGTVLLVNSSAGLVANARWSAYAATKHGLRGFADALRAEEVETGVRVTTVFPSRTATPMQERVHAQEGRTYDASRWIPAEVVAATVLHCLDLPAGVTIPEVTVRPTVPVARG